MGLKLISPVCCPVFLMTCQSARPDATASRSSLLAESLHDRPSQEVVISASSPLSQSSLARDHVFSECYSEVRASNFLSSSLPILVDAPMICQDSHISPMNGPDFSITSECTPVLAKAPARGQDL